VAKKAWHNLSGAKVLYDVNHYCDVTAVELHYAVEKILKSFLAYENKKIPKTHDLNEIHELVIDFIDFSDSKLDLLDIITEYHMKESYPTFDRNMPEREKIKEVLDFTFALFEKVCDILNIDMLEMKV